MSEPTVYTALTRLAEEGILREATGRKRRRLYVYRDYLAPLRAED